MCAARCRAAPAPAQSQGQYSAARWFTFVRAALWNQPWSSASPTSTCRVLVRAAAAPARDVLHRAVIGPEAIGPAPGGHGRDGDAGLVDLRHERGVGILGVAVAEQDDALDPGVGVL